MRFDNITGSEMLFQEMYRDYIRELKSIDPLERRWDVRWFRRDILEFEKLRKYFITDQNEGIVGFITIYLLKNGKEPVWIILSLYIVPDKRRKGYATRAVAHYLKKYRGNFYVSGSEKNIPARLFWSSCVKRFELEELHKKRNTVPDSSNETYIERSETR